MDGIHSKQYCSKSNAHGGPVPASTSPGAKRKGKGGGGKKLIKVVYIGNPVRVTTSAASFRALVQELTGRHADPSRYSGGAAIDVDADDSSGGSQSHAEPQKCAVPSPVSTEVSSDAATADHTSAPAWEYGDDEDSFAPQLIDNSYSVFSPPTFLDGPHN